MTLQTDNSSQASSRLRLALPKGRMAEGVNRLLADAGIRIQSAAREYRPELSLQGCEVKLLKPQAIVKMLELGSRDIGFAGADWVAEFEAPLVELLDTGLDPVRIVVAAPAEAAKQTGFWQRPLVIASELEQTTLRWIAKRQLQATFLRSFGSTEVYPPEDADCIVDVVATGATLRANGLEVIEEIMTSSTRLYASPQALDRPELRDGIEHLVLLLKSVLEARRRVMVEVNVTAEVLQQVVAALPCMREPTIAQLHGQRGFAIKVAAPKSGLPELIGKIKALGGTDIVVSPIAQIVP
ncbi:MAG: ATP phosphoribosyltransferase [Planctomycetota bacterium]